MRRGRREKIEKNTNVKFFIYLSGGVALIMLLTFAITFVVYNNKIKESNYSTLTADRIAELIPNNEINSVETEKELEKNVEKVNNDIGKNIEEVIESMEEKLNEEPEKEEFVERQENVVNENKEEIKEPEFIMPVEGEIIRNFAKDSLIYSDTLEEWIVHLGIDIKADRTTVVKAAESGTVTAIKNDPRYGLTIVMEHTSGFKTIYSNLLTTEFVTEGEVIEKGQSIATVGNSAAFEIVDEPHLHFEILKDEINVSPQIYLN